MTESRTGTLLIASFAAVLVMLGVWTVASVDVSGAQPAAESGPVSSCSAKVEARGREKDRLDVRISCRAGANLTQIQVARIARAGGFGAVKQPKVSARAWGSGSIRKPFRCQNEGGPGGAGQISCVGEGRGPLTVRASMWVAPRQACRLAVRVRLKSLLPVDLSAEESVLPPPVIPYKVVYSRLPAGCR